MPEAWSDKDERQYQKIKDSQLEEGKSKERAKEIAAATVNKQRRKENRTPNKTTRGKGNPHKVLEERSKDELYNIAKERNIKGRSKMNKGELITAIRGRQ